MCKKRVLRLASLGMLLAAVVFVACSLAHPEMGRTIYIGNFLFGWRAWRVCYAAYVLVMAGLFAGSFLVKNGRSGE